MSKLQACETTHAKFVEYMRKLRLTTTNDQSSDHSKIELIKLDCERYITLRKPYCITAIYLPDNVYITKIYKSFTFIYESEDYTDNDDTPIEIILEQCKSLPDMSESSQFFNEEEIYIDGTRYFRHEIIKPCIPFISAVNYENWEIYFNTTLPKQIYIENINLCSRDLIELQDYARNNDIILKSVYKKVHFIDEKPVYKHDYYKYSCWGSIDKIYM